MDIKEYREAILAAMLQAKDDDGNNKIEEDIAKDLLDSFSDDELQDGIAFNTPEDVAAILLGEDDDED